MQVDSQLKCRFVVFAALACIGFVLGTGLRLSGREQELVETDDQRNTRKRLTGAASESMTESGLSNWSVPNFEKVMQSRGLERYATLSRYLLNASGAECRNLSDALQAEGDMDHNFREMIYLRWTQVDPVGAVKQGSYDMGAMWAWAKNDPEAAMKFGIEHGYGRDVLRSIAQEDADKTLEFLEELPEYDCGRVWEGLVASLARTDSKTAVEFALDHNVSMLNSMKNWAANDPEGALEFALGQEDPQRRMKSLEQVLEKISEDDPARAFAVINEMPTGKIRADLRNRILELSVEADPNAAIRSVRGISSGEERNDAFRYVASRIVQMDPERALELLAESRTETGEMKGNIGRPFAATLARLRPEAALRFCQDTPNDGTTQLMAGHIVRYWVREEPMVASTWIRDQPSSLARDAMVSGLVGELSGGPEADFLSAAIWANSLIQESNRDPGTLRMVMDKWLKADREAALRELGAEWMPSSIREYFQSKTSKSD